MCARGIYVLQMNMDMDNLLYPHIGCLSLKRCSLSVYILLAIFLGLIRMFPCNQENILIKEM